MISAQKSLLKFSEVFATAPDNAIIANAPGRLCLIGEHIDYNGGMVLPAAISLGITGLFQPNASGILRVYSRLNDELVELNVRQAQFSRQHSWVNYVAGVVHLLQQRDAQITGGNLFFDSDLPTGAGLSSSAAIEVLTAFLFFQA